MSNRDLLLEAKTRLEEYLGLQIDRHTDHYLPPAHLTGPAKAVERYEYYRNTVDPELAALIDRIDESTALPASIEIVPVDYAAAQGFPT